MGGANRISKLIEPIERRWKPYSGPQFDLIAERLDGVASWAIERTVMHFVANSRGRPDPEVFVNAVSVENKRGAFETNRGGLCDDIPCTDCALCGGSGKVYAVSRNRGTARDFRCTCAAGPRMARHLEPWGPSKYEQFALDPRKKFSDSWANVFHFLAVDCGLALELLRIRIDLGGFKGTWSDFESLAGEYRPKIVEALGTHKDRELLIKSVNNLKGGK